MQDLRSILNVRESLVRFLEEDIGSGDITSDSTIPDELEATGEIICKSSDSIVSGLEEALLVFEICGCVGTAAVKDGSRVNSGKLVMIVQGKAKSILKAERTVLNLVMRMSGIATETHRLARKSKGVTILATRKTAPGLRYFDKKAVMAGGGGAHRMRLDDMVLIKDNHLAITGSPAVCIKKARGTVGTDIKVECEARNKEEAVEAVRAGADIVMLDNFSPSDAAKTIKELSRMGLRKKCKIEISGGVNSRNIRQYAKSKPDFISLGFITHSARAVDFSLELKLARR
jgi:nicotinate-nucleotide pyrophosphorylase (carboxylating)